MTKKIQLGVEVDPTGAKQGLKEIEQAGTQTATALGRSAGEAGKAVDGIGDGAQKAAGKLAAAEKNIIGSIQRATAAAQAGERGTAAFYESLAKQRGVDPAQLRPYLDQLKAAEAISRSAAAGVDKIGVSAAQTAAALRGVPAQFTDIVTSLQGGQAPLTVFLQQGGQLKDMFGGAGAAARALGGFVLGLVNPFSIAAVAAGVLALAYKSGSDEATAYSRALILSGQAAGVSAGQLQDMARAVAATGAGTQGRAAEVLTEIASAAGIGAGNMVRFTAAAVAFEKAGGPAAEETAKAFQSLAKEPLAAALKLNEATNFLTKGTYEQIKALEEQGRTAEAARVAQEGYASAIESRTPGLVESLGTMERAWRGVKDRVVEAWDAVKGVGREQTGQQQIEALQQRIARISSVPDGMVGRESKSLLPELNARLALLQQGAKFEAMSAFYAGQYAENVKLKAAYDKEGLQLLDKEAKKRQEVARAQTEGQKLVTAGLITQAELAARIAAIQAKYTDKPAKAKTIEFKAEQETARAYMKALESLVGIQQQASASADGLTKTQAKLRDVQADPAWASYSRQQREQIITQAAAAQAAEDQAAAVKAGAKVAADAARDYGQWVAALDRSADAVAGQVQALRDEERAAEIAATGRMSLKAAIEEVTIARLRDQQIAAMGNPDAVAAIQREIEARQQLRDAIGKQDMRKAADDAAKEWAQAAEKISDSITDALMRGFESGKGFAQALRDTVVNMFKTTVLKPIISAVVSPVSGAISGAIGSALGMGATSAAAAGGSGLLGNAAGAVGLAGSFGAFGSGVASGLTAWGAGGSVTGLLGSGSALFSGGIASGLGTIAGALGPIALGLGGLYALVKSLDNSGTPHYGASSAFSAAGGLVLGDGVAGLGSRRGAFSASVESMTTQITQTVVGVLDSTALAFGQKAGFSAAAAFADDTSKDKAQGALAIMRNGQLVAGNNQQFQRYADGAKGQEQYLAAVAKDVRTALNSIGLPAWATNLLAQLGNAPSLDQLGKAVDQINATRQALLSLGKVLPQLSGLADTTVTGLIQAFGGVEAMASAAGGYLQAIYSDADRLEIASRGLTETMQKLGFAVPATRDAYRALVEAQNLTTQSGRDTYAALLQLAPAFAEVTGAAEQAAAEQAAAYRQAAEEQARLAEQVAQQGAGLQERLLELQGDSAALRQREIDALAPANRALQERINALEDLQAEEQRLAEVASERASIEQQMLQMLGNTAELRRRELAALDPANRALQERVYALEDAKAAAEAAGRLSDAWAGVADTIEGEVSRIRGLGGQSGATLAGANSAFAIATAQARSGDMEAAGRLPELSRALLDMSQTNARTAVELSAIRAYVADSLAQTAEISRGIGADAQATAALNVAAASSGQSIAAATQTTTLDAAETARIVVAEVATQMTGSSADQTALIAELRAMRQEVVDLRAEARATAGHTAALSRLHSRWDADGLLVRNDSDTPLTTTVI